MEAQKGLKSLLIRVGGLAVVGSLILLSLASLYPSTGAQTVAYPLIPLVVWSDGYHAVEDVAYGLALDFLGNVVVVGTSGIIKYAEDGYRLWQAPYPGVAYGVATDSLADIIVAGTAGLVKLSSEGRRLWAVAGEFYKVTTAAGDLVVAVGPVGVRIYSPSGEAVGELTYPGEPYGVASSGDKVVVIGTGGLAAYELQARDRLWQLAYQGELRGVALDSEGGVIVAGSGGVAKYSPSGRLIWQEPFLGEPQAVATLPAREPSQGDEIVVTGGYKGKDWDYRTVKYSPEGEELWEARYDGDQGDDLPYAVAVSPAGRIYVTGASTLAKGASASSADKDYYTIQYGEKPLPEVLGAQGLEVGERCQPGTIPVARFEVSNPNPLTDEEVSFINRSDDPDGYLLAWSWAFGDGGISQAWEPVHSYSHKGSSTVTLTVVDNDFCTASATAEILIGNRPPEVDFYWNPLEPTDLEEALFTPEFEDLDGEVVYARWELGDGTVIEWDSPGELGPPGHRSQIAYQYPDDGVYPVLLVVRDDDGAEAEVEKNITVLNVPPEASFTWEAQPGAGELRADFRWDVEREVHGSYPQGFMPERPTDLDDIKFEDLSTSAGGEPGATVFTAEGLDRDGSIVSYEWDFDNDGSTDAEGETVAWTFPQAGTYHHVKLTATDDDGDSTTYEEDVKVEAVAGEIVEWEWDFGDNGASGEQHPRHWYQDNGVYEVTLTIWDEAGNSDSITKEIEVLNVPPVADFDWQFELPPDFLPTCGELFPEMGENFACQEPILMNAHIGVVAFSDLSVDSESWLELARWEWDFGNEGWACFEPEADCGIVPEPKVIFLDGEYLFHGDREVWLSVWDDDGDGG
ncbi:MAG: PKD domain-containing protein, partial [Candidatus Bipolaricaulia bacterium]